MNNDSELPPIGILDSGSGGLTVLRELWRQMPQRRYIYIADTLNVPYGDKPIQVVRDLAIGLTSFLRNHGCRVVVMASGTSTVAGLRQAMEIYPDTKIYGTIAAGARAALHASPLSVAVFATNATARSRCFTDAIHELDPKRNVLEVGCPLFVPFVESGSLTDPAVQRAADQYAAQLNRENFGSVILGCTHFPFLETAIKVAIEKNCHGNGKQPTIVDPAQELVFEISETEAKPAKPFDDIGPPRTDFYSTSDAAAFSIQLKRLLGIPHAEVTLVEIPIEQYCAL